MAETETLLVAETETLKKTKTVFSCRIATSIFGGLQFHNFGLKIPVIYLEDTHHPDFLLAKTK